MTNHRLHPGSCDVLLQDAADALEAVTAQFVLGEPLSTLVYETHDRLTRALQSRPADALAEAMKGATGLSSGPDGYGTMKVVASGFPPGTEFALFGLLSAAQADHITSNAREGVHQGYQPGDGNIHDQFDGGHHIKNLADKLAAGETESQQGPSLEGRSGNE